MKAAMQKLGRRLCMLAVVTLLGGLLSATLVRFAPGYGFDERALDPRLSPASVAAIRNEHRLNSGIFSYYGRYLVGAAHGDLGTSEWLQRPIASLIKERFPLTLRSVLFGVLVAWVFALAFSLSGFYVQSFSFAISGTLLSGLLIALPAAVIAMFSVCLRAPVFVAIAVVTFPKLFRYLRNLIDHACAQHCVLAARARG